MVAQTNPSPNLNGLSTYPLEKLLGMWKSGALTVEQLAGHLLQHVILLKNHLSVLEKSLPPGSVPRVQWDKEPSGQ